MGKTKAPGLKWRKLASGLSPVWVADEADVQAGYIPKTANLKAFADNEELLIAKCNALQADMLLWRAGHRRDPLAFDGTIKSLLTVYQVHEESPFRKLKPTTRATYVGVIAKLEAHIGARRVDATSGVDILRWHRIWSTDGEHLAMAAMSRAVLESAVTFGVLMRFAGCPEFLVILREARKKLPRPQPRTAVLSVKDVVAARAAAHARGRPSSARAYAFAFEITLRLWDVIGQWWPMDEGGLSDVLDVDRGTKWFGLRWEDIDENLVLTYTPSKTDGTTGKSVRYSLLKAPMVLEEIAHVPPEKRKGPIIASEDTGLPYISRTFAHGWRLDRKAAGIPSTVWARDLRASGQTEGRASDVSRTDAAMVAGHSERTNAAVYDRAVLQAADRFADARIKGRKQTGNGDGNGR